MATMPRRTATRTVVTITPDVSDDGPTVLVTGDSRPMVGVQLPGLILQVDPVDAVASAMVLVDVAAALVDAAVLVLHPTGDGRSAERQATHVGLLGELITVAWRSGGGVNDTWMPLMDAVEAIEDAGSGRGQ